MSTGAPPSTAAAPLRVLVAGATGLVGRALLDELLAGTAVPATVHALRRAHGPGAAPTTPARAGLHWHEVDFSALPSLPETDEVYIALGTTIAQAGSREAFRAVDFDAVLAVARAARLSGARRLGIVSAMGADPGSWVFYNRVKGEMESAVTALGYPSVTFAQPSLLLGDREAMGQARRSGETWGSRLMAPLSHWLPRNVRPIRATDVARALADAVHAGAPGVRRLRSGQMQA